MTIAAGTDVLLGVGMCALVRAADYLGNPVADASAGLRALDLTVSVRPVPAEPGTPVDSVTGVTPTGRVNAGATLTLEVAQAPTGPVTRPGKHDHTPPGQKKKDKRKQGRP